MSQLPLLLPRSRRCPGGRQRLGHNLEHRVRGWSSGGGVGAEDGSVSDLEWPVQEGGVRIGHPLDPCVVGDPDGISLKDEVEGGQNLAAGRDRASWIGGQVLPPYAWRRQ